MNIPENLRPLPNSKSEKQLHKQKDNQANAVSPKRIFFQFSNAKDSSKDTDQKPAEASIKKHSAIAPREETEKRNGSKTEFLKPTSEADIEKESYLQEYLQKIGNSRAINPPNHSINQTILQTAIKKSSESIIENSSIHPRDRNSLSNLSGSRFFKSDSRDYELSQERQDRSLLNTGVSQTKKTHYNKESYYGDEQVDNNPSLNAGLNRKLFFIFFCFLDLLSFYLENCKMNEGGMIFLNILHFLKISQKI